MCLCECVKERKMPVRRQLTDINPDRTLLFVHTRRCRTPGPKHTNLWSVVAQHCPPDAFLQSCSPFNRSPVSSFVPSSALFGPAFSGCHLSSLMCPVRMFSSVLSNGRPGDNLETAGRYGPKHVVPFQGPVSLASGCLARDDRRYLQSHTHTHTHAWMDGQHSAGCR